MPRIKLTKSVIDALATPPKDVVYWDSASPGFGVKVTPKGRKVFTVLYRTAGTGSRLRKFTIGPYGRVTLHQARVHAQKIFAAKTVGRDRMLSDEELARVIIAARQIGGTYGVVVELLALTGQRRGEVARPT